MTTTRIRAVLPVEPLFALGLTLLVLGVARSSAAQGAPLPSRPLGPVVAVSRTPFTDRAFPVVLTSGAVLVKDQTTRLVTRLDPSLANPTILIDSVYGRPNSYPAPVPGPMNMLTSAPTTLIPFVDDSVLWMGANREQFQVIASNGTFGRVVPVPPGPTPGPGLRCATFSMVPVSSNNLPFQSAKTQWSSTLGMIYEERISKPMRSCDDDINTHRIAEDSVLVIRHDYSRGVHDTIAAMAVDSRVYPIRAGLSATALFSFIDDVVVTTDGTVCVFHAHDVRLEWIGASETRLPGAQLQYTLRPISEANRTRVVDSANAAHRATYDTLSAAYRAKSIARLGSPPTHPVTMPAPGGGSITHEELDDAPVLRPTVLPIEVPDVYPPTPGFQSVLADADNHVWIRLRTSTPDPAVETWEVVSRVGGVVDRVQVPRDRTIVGFAPGYVYLVMHDETAKTSVIEKVRIRS